MPIANGEGRVIKENYAFHYLHKSILCFISYVYVKNEIIARMMTINVRRYAIGNGKRCQTNAIIDPEHEAAKCERKHGWMTSTRNDKVGILFGGKKKCRNDENG